MPICLPWNTDDPKLESLTEGTKLTIAGWGKTTDNIFAVRKNFDKHSVATRTLRKIQIPIITSESQGYKNCKSLKAKFKFCAGGMKGKIIKSTELAKISSFLIH